MLLSEQTCLLSFLAQELTKNLEKGFAQTYFAPTRRLASLLLLKFLRVLVFYFSCNLLLKTSLKKIKEKINSTLMLYPL